MSEEKYVITIMETTKPFNRLFGNLWQITAEKEETPIVLPPEELFKGYYALICKGIITIPIRYKEINFVLAPADVDLSSHDYRTYAGCDVHFTLKEKKMQVAVFKGEFNFRRVLSILTHWILEHKGVQRIGVSKYSLKDLLAIGGIDKKWYTSDEIEGQKGLLNYNRFYYLISEIFDFGHCGIISRARTTVNLTDETGKPYPLNTFLEVHREIKDYVISTQNMEDKVLVRYRLDGRTYAPIGVEYLSPKKYYLPKFNMTFYDKLTREYATDSIKLQMVEACKDDPFVALAYRYRPGRRRMGEPEAIAPSLATPIITLSNREFYEEKLKRKLLWEDVTRLHPKLHYYGALALRNIINAAKIEIFGTPLEFDLPLYVEKILEAKKEELRKGILYHIPQPIILYRDWTQKVISHRLKGRLKDDILKPFENFPYIPLSPEKSRKLGFSIICPEPVKEKAKLLKQNLEPSKMITLLFGQTGKDLADQKRLVNYEWIDAARPDAYLSKVREIKDEYIGHFALYPPRTIPISTDIFRVLKHESAYNDIPIQPIQLRKSFTFFDENLWYAMFRKIGGSVVGMDLSEVAVPKNFVLTARDVSGRQEGTEIRYAALTSSIGPDMARGFILAERAAIERETIENVYEILEKTKEMVWKRKMKEMPTAVISLRDGYTPSFEHEEEIRFYEENDIAAVTIDLTKDAGGKFLRKVMATIEPYNVPLAAVILDGKTAIVQPHKVRAPFPPSPLKLKISYRGGEKLANFSVYDAACVVAYSTFITHATPAVEYVKTPDVLAKAHKAADLYRIAALPTTGVFWIGHLD